MSTRYRDRVLVCTIPNISLYVKKIYQELGVGASYIAGSLESAGFKVDCLDLNMALNTIRDERPLDNSEKDILCYRRPFVQYYHQPHPSRLKDWLDAFEKLPGLLNVEDYKYILFSMDRRDYSSMLGVSVLHFAFLLAQRLKRRTAATIIAGGKQALHSAGHWYCKSLLEEENLSSLDAIFSKNAHSTLIDFIDELEAGKVQLPLPNRVIDKASLFSSLRGFLPKYDIVNQDDQYVDPKELFPEYIRKKYTKLNDVDPFFLAPYKFSLGCPFTCSFCEDGKVDHKRFDLDLVVQQLSELSSRGYKYLKWYNTNVNFHLRFAIDLCDQIVKNNIQILFSDSCNSWVVSEELFQKLGKAGCVKLWYGVENTNERLLSYLNKSKVKLERLEKTLKWAAANDIWNCANVIYNFPHESDQQFEELLQFLGRDEIIDCFERNEYMLLANTEMSSDPDKFGIKVQSIAANGSIGGYDEVGGLPWREKVLQGRRRLDRIAETFPEVDRVLKFNDYLLFGARIAGYNRLQIKQIFSEMGNYAKAHRLENYYYQKYHIYIPVSHIYEVPEDAIRGNLLPDRAPISRQSPGGGFVPV